MISVILPVYNRPQFVIDAIESILNQTYKDIEIIVVDDGSTDETKSALRRYENQISYIYQDNKGPSSARNTGILHSKGELIAFLDSDDLFLPEKLEKQIRFFTKSNIGLVYSYYYQLDCNKDRSRVRRPDLSADRKIMQKELLSRQHTIRTSTVVMKRECIEKVGLFNEEYLFSQDWDMWLRIASQYDFAVAREPLAVYRRHSDCRVNQKNNSFHSSIIKNATKLFNLSQN